MSSAVFVVIAALASILISSYDVSGHALWLVSRLIAWALFAVVMIVNARTRENRAELSANLAATPRRIIVAVYGPTIWLPTGALALALVLVVLGLFPVQDKRST